MALALSLAWWSLAFLVCLLMGLGAWMVFLWGVRSGQFRHSDATASEMLEHDQRETVGDQP